MTESEVPTLGLGSEQRQMWTQTVMTLAYGVRERRQALGQVAWSDEQTAERRQERTERIADPTVRAMSTDEWTEAVDRRQRRHGGERHTHSGAGWVTVWIGPLNDGRTALLASAGPTGSTTPTATAAVSCADTPTAMELADELLAGGPDQVDRLHAFATLSARRAAAAADDLTEPDPDRLARTASAVRQVWAGPRYTALAEAIVASPAFPALAWRLHELEERGYAFTDVLGRIDPDRLMGSNVRDPAALAEWFVEQMAPDLRVVNLDADLDADDPAAASSRAASRTPTAGPAPTPHPSPTPHPTPPTPGPASATAAADPAAGATRKPGAARPSAPRVDAAAAAAQDAAVQPLLAAAYPPELVQRLQASRAYPRLRAYLHQLHQQGRPVATTLGDVPAARLDGARDPASYLHAAVRRHPLAAPLQPSGPDRAAMADLVRAAMPKSVADKVVASKAWPVLARRLETWTAEGLPVADLLADLPAGRVFAARTPAAYAAHLMDLKVDAHRSRRAGPAGRPRQGRPRQSAGPAPPPPRRAEADRRAPRRPAAQPSPPPTRPPPPRRRQPRTSTPGPGPPTTRDASRNRHRPIRRTCSTTRTSTCSASSTRCPPVTVETGTPGAAPQPPTTQAGTGRTRGRRPPDRDVDERWLVGDYLVVDRAVTDADNVDSTRNDDVAIVVDGTVLWSEDLDPANAVDRVGLEATVGLGSAARAERVEARLDAPQTSPAAGADASTATPRAPPLRAPSPPDRRRPPGASSWSSRRRRRKASAPSWRVCAPPRPGPGRPATGRRGPAPRRRGTRPAPPNNGATRRPRPRVPRSPAHHPRRTPPDAGRKAHGGWPRRAPRRPAASIRRGRPSR